MPCPEWFSDDGVTCESLSEELPMRIPKLHRLRGIAYLSGRNRAHDRAYVRRAILGNHCP